MVRIKGQRTTWKELSDALTVLEAKLQKRDVESVKIIKKGVKKDDSKIQKK